MLLQIRFGSLGIRGRSLQDAKPWPQTPEDIAQRHDDPWLQARKRQALCTDVRQKTNISQAHDWFARWAFYIRRLLIFSDRNSISSVEHLSLSLPSINPPPLSLRILSWNDWSVRPFNLFISSTVTHAVATLLERKLITERNYFDAHTN